MVREYSLKILTGETRISFLHRAEKALFCRQHQSFAIDVDTAAFQHNAPSAYFRPPALHPESSADLFGHAVVALPIGILSPGVELPVGDGELAVPGTEEDWTIIACPN